jgi:hypothetical protein
MRLTVDLPEMEDSMRYIFPFLGFLILAPALLHAQEIERLSEIPEEIREVLAAADVQELYVVNGMRVAESNVIAANQLAFQDDGSSLVFPDVRVPHIIIAAQRLRLTDVSRIYSIMRDPAIRGMSGGDGTDGARGSPSFIPDRGSRPGRHGGDGENGRAGEAGETLAHPDVYLIIGEIESQTGSALNSSVRLLFPGLNGGDGGQGGNGGRGGDGERGNTSSNNLFTCTSGPGRGGNGGDGGRYGLGGAAGSGSNGANIYLIGPADVIDILSYFPIRNGGGLAGEPGQCGRSGPGGRRGLEGPLVTHCNAAGRDGVSGASPERPNPCTGAVGDPGAFGRVFAVTAPVASLFNQN